MPAKPCLVSVSLGRIDGSGLRRLLRPVTSGIVGGLHAEGMTRGSALVQPRPGVVPGLARRTVEPPLKSRYANEGEHCKYKGGNTNDAYAHPDVMNDGVVF